MAAADPDVEFFGLTIPPGTVVPAGDGDSDAEDGVTLIHATQFALGAAPAPGRHTVFAVRDDGQEYAVGTLEAGRVDQFSCDFMVSSTPTVPAVSFRHTGGSDVFATGYKTVASLLDDFDGASDEGDALGDALYGSSSGEEEEEAGAVCPGGGRAGRPGAAAANEI